MSAIICQVGMVVDENEDPNSITTTSQIGSHELENDVDAGVDQSESDLEPQISEEVII